VSVSFVLVVRVRESLRSFEKTRSSQLKNLFSNIPTSASVEKSP
jgi:hypothetical protein